ITYSPGLAGLIARMADGLTKSDGPLAKQSTSLANSITALTARQEAAQARLETRRESLSRQFAAMETAIAKWQAQGSWLSGQVTALRNMMSSGQP
ncbi:MAG: flagellar filament capping protein FliD, partial [Gemmatimonadaceae bacterium]